MSGQLSSELETLLTPQERFDERFELWRRRAGIDMCDFAYANPYDGPDRTVMGAIEDALHTLRTLQLQYTPYGGNPVTRRLIAERLSKTHDSPFGWRDIVLTPGAMAALNVVFRAVRTTAVDEVVVLIPCWMDYPLYLTQLGIKPVLVSLTRDAFHFDLARIERAITPATRAIIFSQPANPTGVLYCDEELARLADLLREKAKGSSQPPILIADECHREVVYLPDKFVSPLPHYDATVIVYSFGKSLLIQGQRIGYTAVSPRMPSRESFVQALERSCRMMGFCTPTALMQLAIRKLLAHGPDLQRLSARRELLSSALRAYGYSVVPGQATFFLYVRSPNPDDFAFTERLASKGVLVLPGSLFHDSGYFRISLTASDEMVERALPVFESAIHG